MKTLLSKNQLGVLALFFGLLFGNLSQAKAESNYYRGVSFQVFYDALTPYGDWVKDARYGYIWLPAVYEEFHPYGTNGHWVMTEYGNTWVSDYDWGWATFHYGRWYFDDYYQSWAWIPGYDWAPAWVSWRSGGGYYGWAPLGPGVSINVRINIPTRHWVFIPYGRIHHRNVFNYYAPYAHHRTKIKIINRTTVINNTVVYNNHNYYAGPSHREVERVTRQVVPVYNIRSAEAPGRAAVGRNEVRMYRPEVEESRGRNAEARPSRVLESTEARSARASRTVNPSGAGESNQPNRSVNGQNGSSGRAASPSGTRGNGDIELRPAPSDTRNRGEMNQPSRSTQPSRQESIRTQPAPSRESQVRTQPAPVRENQVRTQPAPSRESQVRTQPHSAPRERVEPRSSTPSRGSEVKQQPAPQVRTAPSRGSDSRVEAPSRKGNQAQVRSSAPSRGNAPASRTESSSPSRGNSRERSNN